MAAAQHPPSCPGTVPQQKGCSGDKVLPIHSECRMQQRHNPIRTPPPLTFRLSGGRGGQAAALGAAEATGPGRRKEASREKHQFPEQQTQTRQAPTSAPRLGGCRSHQQSSGALREAGRMRPSGRGWGTASTAEPGPGLPRAGGDKGTVGQAAWDAAALSHAVGSRASHVPCASILLRVCCERASVSPGGDGRGDAVVLSTLLSSPAWVLHAW